MSDNSTNLEVLIQIREELSGLRRTQDGLRQTTQEANSLGNVLRQGLGIGGGMALATGAIALLKNTLVGTTREAFAFAGQTKDMAEALGVSATRLQILIQEFKAAGVDIGRLNMAVNTQTQSLAEARDEGSAAAAAYRALGLEASRLESLPIEERMLAVTRAMERSTDKTAAFQAAAQILGARQLPQLLNAMRRLGIEGFDALDKLYTQQGLIMGEDTIARLDRAEKAWKRLWDSIVIGSGEAIGVVDRIAESAQKAPGPTWLALAKAMILGPAGLGDLAAVVGQQTASAGGETPPPAGAPVAPLPLARTAAWRAAELDLMRAQGREAVILASTWEVEVHRRRKLIAVIGEQIRLEQRLLSLLRETPLTPQETQEERDRAIVQAQNRIGLLQQKQVSEVLGPKPRVMQSLDDYRAIEDPNRPGYMTAAQGMQTGLVEWVTSLGSTGEQVASILNNSLGQTLSSLSSDIWEAMKGTQGWGSAFKNVGNIAGRMLTQMIIQMTLVKSLQVALGWLGIVSGAAAGGGGAAPTDGGAFPTLTGLADTSAFIGGGAGAGAGGGTFVTSGPATLTVGDNPGGVELVHVVPLSGKGRSWASGSLAHFAGGGSLLAGNGLRNLGNTLAAPVHVSYNFSLGLAASIRAEVMAMTPELRLLAIDAVAEAHRRNQLKLA